MSVNKNLTLKELVDLLDSGGTISPERMEETLRYILKNVAPYMLRIDAMVKDTQYGELDMKLVCRAGDVDKISFFQNKTWLKNSNT